MIEIVTLNDYQNYMKRTYKPERMLNHVLGLVGEAGEVFEKHPEAADLLKHAARIAEMVKKEVYHKKPFAREKLKDELGDVLWYHSALASDYDLTLQEIGQHNIEKLIARYPEGFVHGGGIR